MKPLPDTVIGAMESVPHAEDEGPTLVLDIAHVGVYHRKKIYLTRDGAEVLVGILQAALREWGDVRGVRVTRADAE